MNSTPSGPGLFQSIGPDKGRNPGLGIFLTIIGVVAFVGILVVGLLAVARPGAKGPTAEKAPVDIAPPYEPRPYTRPIDASTPPITYASVTPSEEYELPDGATVASEPARVHAISDESERQKAIDMARQYAAQGGTPKPLNGR